MGGCKNKGIPNAHVSLVLSCLNVDSIVQLDAVSFKIKTDLNLYSDGDRSSKLAIFIPRFRGFFKTRSTGQH